jgi:hypothetical protein
VLVATVILGIAGGVVNAGEVVGASISVDMMDMTVQS